MPTHGHHFALTREEAKRLFTAKGETAMREFIAKLAQSPEIQAEGRMQASQSAWNAIHRCLTGGTLDPTAGEPPLNLCVLGGKEISPGVRLVRPDMVPHVAAALAAITPEELRTRYDRIDPADYGQTLTEDDFGRIWDCYRLLCDFYRRAAADGNAVIFARGAFCVT